MAINRPSGFKFSRLDSIGAPDAEMDADFLDACFFDTGDLALLQDPSDRRVILLGRTGTGKSALLRELAKRNSKQTIMIRPEALALTHIANSQMLTFISGLGINLDPLFKLLWRHVFVVELLRTYFHQHSPQIPQSGILAWLQGLFAGPSREEQEAQEAIAYLRQWGESFWEQTEYRVKEITHKIETELEDSLKASLGPGCLSLGVGGTAKESLSEEQKIEVKRRTQEIISQAQVQDLSKVMKLLDRVLSDRQKTYYVVVDQLDENWIEEKLRYQLVKALILTAREFIGVANAKIVLGVRRDLIDRVFRLTRDSGFQEEKFVGNYLPLTWTKEQIISVLGARVSRLVSRRYTKQSVSYADVLPETYDGMNIADAIFHIAHRPRDVIALFNCCILAGAEKAYIGTHEFSVALGEYSRGRLRALADEWHADFPKLLDYARILNERPPSFRIGAVSDEALEELCLELASEYPEKDGSTIHGLCHSVVEGDLPISTFREQLFHGFYKIGLVGLKVLADTKASWADAAGQSVTRTQVNQDVGVYVRPMYWRSLGIVARCEGAGNMSSVNG